MIARLFLFSSILSFSLFASAQVVDTTLVDNDDTIDMAVKGHFVLSAGSELPELPGVIISPNPLQGTIIQVHFDKYVPDGLAQMYITNLNGELIFQGMIMVTNNTAYVDISEKRLSRGMYHITLIRGNQKVSGRFVVNDEY